jgi:hypothetical protein
MPAHRGTAIGLREDTPDRAPLLPLARLWMKTSAKGNEYIVGRLRIAKLVLLSVREGQIDGHTHELLITAPTDARRQEEAAERTQSAKRHARGIAKPWSRSDQPSKVSIEDDPMPV